MLECAHVAGTWVPAPWVVPQDLLRPSQKTVGAVPPGYARKGWCFSESTTRNESEGSALRTKSGLRVGIVEDSGSFSLHCRAHPHLRLFFFSSGYYISLFWLLLGISS